MMSFFEGLCGCFSPELKGKIIDYLSSANLNRQLMEEEKCAEEDQAPEKSIYAQVKTKSYYFMKLKEEEEHPRPASLRDEVQQNAKDNSQEPNYYPSDAPQNQQTYDQIYSKKLATLRRILNQEIGPDYSKIYDSQDELNLKIYCKPEIYPSRRINAYRFSFDIAHSNLSEKSYLNLPHTAHHEPLLEKKLELSKTQAEINICHRFYKKILVIQQHDFITAEKCQSFVEEKSPVVYNTIFSVKGGWQKTEDHSRGWIHLAGLRVSVQTNELEHSTSLRDSEQHLHFQAYVNAELDISINANMLKQPIAKEIRVYVQKLVCSLTNSDAI